MAGCETASTGPNHYQLLRLPPTASAQDLRQAFRSLSKLYHPDTTLLPAPQAEEQFRQLQLAYLTLNDPERRRAYDSQLQAVPLQPAPVRRLERSLSVRRALSGGEWFALVLLGVALVLSLVLGLSLAWWRGLELVTPPTSWLDAPAVQTAGTSGAETGHERPAPSADPALQPSLAVS
ncbi:J domain-containing protein [Synechococcus sp. Tobar12-5m-g]|nr:J domain-containing protein [Synechococcus sp. Tobar12-5m-g]MCP9874128.1 J domain-containing protein [Synechococcus sp. Cruz CV-v-12]